MPHKAVGSLSERILIQTLCLVEALKNGGPAKDVNALLNERESAIGELKSSGETIDSEMLSRIAAAETRFVQAVEAEKTLIVASLTRAGTERKVFRAYRTPASQIADRGIES